MSLWFQALQRYFWSSSTRLDDLDAQANLSRNPDGMWGLVLKADFEAIKKLAKENAKVVDTRGPFGETMLLLMLLYDSEQHFNIAKFIMQEFPHTISAIYEEEEYHGENILHIAIVNKRFERVKYIVDRAPELMFGRADGKSFRSGQPCYFGEYPLFFAVCTNQKSLVQYLVDKGAPMDVADSNDNNLLHLCVVHNLSDMYSFILDLFAQKYPNALSLHKRINRSNYSPFALAAHLNRKEMFEFLLEKSRKLYWSYGHVTCHLYELGQLDPPLNSPGLFLSCVFLYLEYDYGALQTIINQGNLSLLSLPRIQELVNTKWDRTASYMFYWRFVLTVVFIVLILLNSILRCEGDDELHLYCTNQSFIMIFTRVLMEIGVCFGSLYKISREISELIKSGLQYFKLSGSALLENFLSLNFSFLIVIHFICRFYGHPYSPVFLALGSLTLWLYLLFFLLGFRLTGPFIIMMYHMLIKDMSRFFILVFVFYSGFSQAMYVVLKNDGFGGYFSQFQSLSLAMLGDFDFDEYSAGGHFPNSLLIIVIIIGIMLLNILVALMSDTYKKILLEADQQWMLERARITFSIISEIPADRVYPYWTTINGERFFQVICANKSHFFTETLDESNKYRKLFGLPLLESLADPFNLIDKRTLLISHDKEVTEELTAQIELSSQEGTIWNAVYLGKLDRVKELVKLNKNVVFSRGPMGEIPFHLALLYESDAHFEIVEYFIDNFPSVVYQIYEGKLYQGENALHMAIMQRQLGRVRFFLEKCTALLAGRAVGTFFKQGMPCYFGEYPLLFAVSLNQKSVVTYLLNSGALMDIADSDGNNVFHFCVIYDLKDMYTFLFNLWNERYPEEDCKLYKRKNKNQLTPFTLAAYLNKVAIFEHLMETNRIVHWSYGHVSCLLYELEELDPIDPDCRSKGALQLVINQGNMDFLELPRITELLNTQWKACAQERFTYRFWGTILFIAAFAFTTILRCGSNIVETVDCGTQSWFIVILRILIESGVFLFSVFKTLNEVREIYLNGISAYFSLRGSALLENIVSLGFCGSILISYTMRMFGHPWSDVPLALGSFLSWMYLLFFLLGFRLTGPFIIIMYEILVEDMSRFAMMGMVFYCGFAQALYVLSRDNGFGDYFSRVRSLFLTILGEFDFDEYTSGNYVPFSVFIIVCVIFVGIVLLNILLAMMQDTYKNVLKHADKQWILERARITFSIISEMRKEEIPSYWMQIHGKRYFQVLASNTSHYIAETECESDAYRRSLSVHQNK